MKFGGTLIWRIKEVCQTLICQLATFVLLIIGFTVNLPNFLPPICFKRQFAKLNSRQTIVFYSIIHTHKQDSIPNTHTCTQTKS